MDFNSANTENLAGISFDKGAGNTTIDNATIGIVRLMPNAQVTMELGSGNSMGVEKASNLDLQEGSSLKVTTDKMALTGNTRSAALVGLDSDGRTSDSTVRIGKNATLSVIRTGVAISDSPLLAMGPLDGNGEIYHLEVNGGSLDLEDSAYSNKQQQDLSQKYDNFKSNYWPAILTMWGTSSQNYINFNNAKLVSLLRTAEGKPGLLIKTEGGGDMTSHQTHIVINSKDTKYNTPLTIIPNGETKPETWNVKYLNNTSQGGNFAFGFRTDRNIWNKQGSEYMKDSVNSKYGDNEVILTPSASDQGSNSFNDGKVVPDQNGSTASKALNSFINQFSWWNVSGVKFGSELILTPSYKSVDVKQGQTATVDPTFTDANGDAATMPEGTTFKAGTDTPTWATVDQSTGTVTLKPGTDVTPGAYNIPVTVTYPDGIANETTVPVIVTKDGQTVTWGDKGAVVTNVDASKLNAHETSDNSQVLSPAGAVTAESYKLTDGKLSTTANPITIDPSTITWGTTPDTTVETATAAGKQIENQTIKIDFSNNDAVKDILGSKNGTVTTNPFTINAKSAGAKNVTTPVEVKLGSDLTDAQFAQLVENNIPTDQISKTEWSTKPDAKGNGGVIKITFKDNAANGQPTYLNINIPASSIKITTDAGDNTPAGQNVSTKVGTVPNAADGIQNKGDLPSGTTYTWKETPDVTTPGKKPAVVVVTYPDGTKDEVNTNVIVNADPVVKPITTTVNGTPAATDGIANLNNGGTTLVDGYPSSATWTTAPDTSKPGATSGVAEVTYPDCTKETVTIPVAVNDNHDITIIDDNGHTISLHANDVITHKTSETNIIGQPVLETIKLSYYQGGQKYSTPYIYTLNADKSAYVLTQTGDNPEGVTVNAPERIPVSDIKVSWVPAGTTLFGDVKGNGQPTSVAGADNGGTETIKYTGNDNAQANGYPKYVVAVDSSNVNWPIYGKGPSAMYPFPSVYIYGAKANGVIPSVNSDTTDVKAALGDASKVVDTTALTSANNSAVSSVEWQTTPDLTKANAKAPATVRINFTDGSHLDIPVSVNVIKVDQGVDNKDDHDLYRDITRTITVEGQTDPVVQHVIYSRAKSTDLSKPAGSQVTYTDWVAAKDKDGNTVTNFPQLEVTKAGYTATATGATIETKDGKQYVPASDTIGPDSQKETVNVTYTANEHTLVITYIDKDGNKVGNPYNVSGKTGEKVDLDVPGHVPTNWTLVPNEGYLKDYTFGSDDPQPVTYTVEHKTEVVPVDKTNKDSYREVVQTIEEIPAGKTEAEKTTVRTTTVPFQRTGVKDLVTGDITWNGAWQGPEGSIDKDGKATYTIPVYDVKQVKGYDSYVNGAKATQVPTEDVNADSANSTYTITYVKQSSTPVLYNPSRDDMSVTRTINYDVSGTNHEAIAPITQTVEYTRADDQGNAGYQDPVTGNITWNAWHVKSGKAEFASTKVEQIKGYDSYVDGTKATEVPSAAVVEKDGVPQSGATVTVSYKKQADTPIKYDAHRDDMKVTRTINYDVSGTNHEAIAPITQTVEYTRADDQGNAGYQDPVTGNITWNSWHVKSGKAEFASTKVEQIKGYDSYVDGTKATEVPSAAVVEKDGVPQSGATVTVSYKKQADTPIKYDAHRDDMKVTRTINYDVSGTNHKAIAPITQTVEYTRADDQGNAGYQDPVTGNITWNAWHVKSGKAEFTSTKVEQIKGYDSYVDGTKATEVPSAAVVEKDGVPQSGATVTVSYKKQADTPVPYKPGQKGVNDGMNRYVTRTIVVNNPDGTKTNEVQTVHFSREDAKGNAGYQDPATDEITWNAWHVAGDLNATEGSWAEYDAPKVKGYTANPASVAATDVTAETKDTTVTINYTKNSDTPVPYKPGQKGVNDDMNRYVTRTIIVNNPDGTKTNEVQTVHFSREDAKGNAGYQDPATDEITWNAWHVAGDLNATEGSWAEYDAPKVKGYTADPISVEQVTVNADTPSTTVTINYHKDSATPIKWDGTNDNMYREVTRTITVHLPNTDPQIQVQTVKFTREDAKGNAGYQDPATGDITWNAWHVVNSTAQTGTWTSYTAPAVEGYTANPANVAKETVTPTTQNAMVDITYTQTDANKYTPQGQDVNTKTGVVPDPAEGIKNKGDLPEGTKYTWKETPDVTTPGNKPATVVVTYPDGSKDEVPVTVHVTKPSTNADDYNPEGQDVYTQIGNVPDSGKGIKNQGDLPSGTSYTWKETPDVTTAGDKPATVVVNYPDGSQDEVLVTVHVTDPSTDADKYTPEGQNITTPEGTVPDAAEGIKNKSDLPGGTTYTWTNPAQVTEDVKHPGSHTEEITVIYPDGSQDTVTVTVTVPAPQGQDVTTDQGKLPDPGDAIKNKDQLPGGTTYTWKDTPDVTTPGDHPGVVTVHFPDGTTYDVTVTVHVNAVTPTHDDNNNASHSDNHSVTEKDNTELSNGADNNGNHHSAKALPQTGNDDTNISALAGLSLASLASLLGFAEYDKKRKADK